ncbi:hypothetical protein KCU67_g5721, partial [Aureobasidium melanogenum]
MDVANEMFGDTVVMLPGSYVALNSHWEDWNLPNWFREDGDTTNYPLEIAESRIEDLEKRQQGYDFEATNYETVATPGRKDAAASSSSTLTEENRKEAPPAFPEMSNTKASKESTTEHHSDDDLPPTIPNTTNPSKHSDGNPHLPGGIAPPSSSPDTNTTTVQRISQEELTKRQYYTELFSLYDQVSVLHFTAMGKPWGVNRNILSERRPGAHPLFAEQFMAWRKVAKEICATGVVVEL